MEPKPKYRTGPNMPDDGFFKVFLDPIIGEDNPVRGIAAFVDYLDMETLGFAHAVPFGARLSKAKENH